MQDARTNPPGPTDTVPAWLSPGEAVLNKGAAELIGRDKIAHANRMGMRFQNAPGYVNGTSDIDIARDYLSKRGLQQNTGAPAPAMNSSPAASVSPVETVAPPKQTSWGDGTSGASRGFATSRMSPLQKDPATQPSMPKQIVASDPNQANVPNATVLAAMHARDTGMGVEHAQNLMDMLPDNTPTTHSSWTTHPDGSLQAANPGSHTSYAQQQPLRRPMGMKPLSVSLGSGDANEDAISLERQRMQAEDRQSSLSSMVNSGPRPSYSDSPELDSTIHRLQFSSAPGFVDGTERIKHVEDPADYYINHGDKPLSPLGTGSIPSQAEAGDLSPSEQLARRGMRGKLDYYDANNSVSGDVSREMERAAPQRMPLSVAPRTLQSGIPLHGGHYEGDTPVASQGRGITPRYDPVSGKLSQEADVANAEVDRLLSLSAGRGGHAADPEVLRAAQAKAYEANQAEQMRKGASEEPKKPAVPQSEQKASVTNLAANDPNRVLMVNDPEVDQATKMKVRAGNPVDPTNLQSGEGYIKTAGGMRGYRSDPVGQHTYAYDGKGGMKDLGSYRSPLQRADETSQQFAERMRSHIAAETADHDFQTQQNELMQRANTAMAYAADPNTSPEIRQAMTHIMSGLLSQHQNNAQLRTTQQAGAATAGAAIADHTMTHAENRAKIGLSAQKQATADDKAAYELNLRQEKGTLEEELAKYDQQWFGGMRNSGRIDEIKQKLANINAQLAPKEIALAQVKTEENLDK